MSGGGRPAPSSATGNSPRDHARQQTVRVELGERSYSIEIAPGLLDHVGERARALSLGKNVILISDENVARHHAARVGASLLGAGFDPSQVIVPAGETSKSSDILNRIYDHCVERRLPRQGWILALGGGVVGDLAGYAAATWLRGVDFIQAPTSVVAMVDSSVGGKTGINHPKGKNLIGAFWQPRLVVIDPRALATLDPRELRAGMAEIIKHGVIRDAAYFEEIERNASAFLKLDDGAVASAVAGSCRIKAAVAGADERETTGLRAILNFGHTLGHALEAVAGYGVLSHGEAVAIGMEAAGRIARNRGLWASEDHYRMSALLAACELPRRIPAGLDREAIFNAMKLDKKAREGTIRFVLPTRIGLVSLYDDVTRAEIERVISEIETPPE